MTYAHAAALVGGAPLHRHSPGRGVGVILAELLGPHPHGWGQRLAIDDIRRAERHRRSTDRRLEHQPRETTVNNIGETGGDGGSSGGGFGGEGSSGGFGGDGSSGG